MKLEKGEQKQYFKAEGEWCYIWTPPGFDPGKPAPLLIHHHGEMNAGLGCHHPAPEHLNMGMAAAHQDEFSDPLPLAPRPPLAGRHRHDPLISGPTQPGVHTGII